MKKIAWVLTMALLASALLAVAPATSLAAGGKIAFIRGGNLCLMNGDGTSQRRVARTVPVEKCPTWARNGKTVAFARITRYPGNVYRSSVWAASPTGTNIRRVYFTEPMRGYKSTSIDCLSFSPNGASIAVADRAFKGTTFVNRVLVVNRLTKHARVVFKQNGDWADGYNVSYNADGKRLLVNTLPTDVSNGGLMVINLATGRKTNLPGAGGWAASYSPDGTKIACVRVNAVGDGVKYDLVVMNANGSSAQTLLSTSTNQNAGFFDSPTIAWSGDGARLAYYLSTMNTPPVYSTWTIDIATKAAAKVAGNAAQPAWQR